MKMMLANGSPLPVTHRVGTHLVEIVLRLVFKLFKNYFMNQFNICSLRDIMPHSHHFFPEGDAGVIIYI